MKNIDNKTLLFYYFQLDKNQHYNATTIDTKGQPATIKDALLSLPFDLNEGIYHFRFKSQLVQGDQKILSWIDINNLSAKVPMINGAIYMKILRLKESNQNKLFTIEKLKKADIIKFGKYINGQPNKNNNGTKNTVNGNKDGVLPQQHGSNQNNQSKVNGGSSKSPSITTQNTQNPINNNINVKSPVKNINPLQPPPQPPQNKIPTDNIDFINFNKQQVKAPKIITTTIQQNLQTFTNQFHEQQKHKQNQKLASLELEQTIKKWGYTNGKIINNTVTLLATLHTIWPQWQQVSLTDMLKPEQVNNIFKKAVIKVHPDKNRSRHFKEKYLSKRVFQLLNQSRKL